MTLAVAFGEAAPISPFRSVRDAIAHAVNAFEDGRFVYVKRNGDIAERSYKETFDIARRLQLALRGRGMTPGDGLIINLNDSEAFVPALWAAMIGGFVAIPFLRTSERRFGDLSTVAAFARSRLGGVFALTDEKNVTTERAPWLLRFDALLFEGRKESPEGMGATHESRPKDLRLAVMTSGTTGRPRMVGLSDGAVLARWWPKLPGTPNARAFLSWSPFDHIMGLFSAAPNVSCKVHLDAERFAAEPLTWLDLLETKGVTHATMTNFGMSLIVEELRSCPERSWRLDHVSRIGVGAEAISADICCQFLERLRSFGIARDSIILGYGLTECGPVAGGGTAFSEIACSEADRGVSLDRPAPGHSIRIVGMRDQILKESEVGCIEVRGPTMTSGYLGDEEETKGLLREDNWLRTGDLGFLKGGKLTVVGREKEVIFVNAKKYSCQEIEAAIVSRSRFQELFAAPLAEGAASRASTRGKPFAIFVVVNNPDDQSLADIALEIRTILALAFKMTPEAVALIRKEDLPRTSLGKIQRFQLGAMIDEFPSKARVYRFTADQSHTVSTASVESLEQAIADVWSKLIECEQIVDFDADFYDLGGDSVLGLQMTFALEKMFGVHIPADGFPEALTVRALARCLRREGVDINRSAIRDTLPDWLVFRMHEFLASWPGTPTGESAFMRKVGTADHGIPVFWVLQDVAEARNVGTWIGSRRPAYVFHSAAKLIEYDSITAQALVSRYVEEITKVYPEGPLIIGGNCRGAIVALAIAREFLAVGRTIKLLAIAETPFVDLFGRAPFHAPVAMYLATGSKFNPYRKYRSPDKGMKDLLPAGHRMTPVACGYSQILLEPSIEVLGSDLEEAIKWSEGPKPSLKGRRQSTGIYPSSAYLCRIVAPFEKFNLTSSQQVDVKLEVHNLSSTDWSAFEESGFAVGNHWLSTLGEVVIWSDGRTPIARRIPAGRKDHMSLLVTAPAKPGDYLLEIDLVEEGRRWFGEHSSIPLHILVTVTAEAARTMEITETTSPRDWDDDIRAVRAKIFASALPYWRRRGANIMLSFLKRVGRLS